MGRIPGRRRERSPQRGVEQDFLRLNIPYFVIARLVRATHFLFDGKMGRPHEAGDDEWRD
jgi:hypothetical protein